VGSGAHKKVFLVQPLYSYFIHNTTYNPHTCSDTLALSKLSLQQGPTNLQTL